MNAIDNVVKFNTDDEIQRVYKSFMDSRRSQRTRVEYEKRIDEFFTMVLKSNYRGINFLKATDIINIKKSDIINLYITPLKKRGNVDSTIITKINSVRSLFNEFLSNNIPVNPMIFKNNLKNKKNHHKALSHSELLELIEFMKTEDDGLEKYLLTKMLFHVANRTTATVYLKWSEIIRRHDFKTGQDVWVVESEDKGEKMTPKPISDELYNELLQLKQSDVDNVFPVLSSSEGAYRRYERSLKRFATIKDKDWSMHSLKATIITVAFQMTKDIELCRQLGGHSSIATTGMYIREEEDYTKQLSYVMSKDMDVDIFDNMSGDDIKKFINGHEDIKRLIVMRLNT